MSTNEAVDGAAEASAMTNGVSANESAPSPAPSPAPPATSSPPPTALSQQQSQPSTAMDDGNVTAHISSAAQVEGGVSTYGAVKQFKETNNDNNSNTNYTKSDGYHHIPNNHYNNKISPKMDLLSGACYVFSMDGDRKYHLDELEDGASYVVSSFKAFKIQRLFQLHQLFQFLGIVRSLRRK
ncbi:dual specificity protein kinase splA-like isoform X3 [Bactrocera tryoni]|uniref:dual specificity protein kinase splA-like isoform X3 n=1 Tax=Bactrocera tryoni TaxID=59916 RepID=UPI001A986799|nr:dual specificity protein kinase splA-like isoform X3 [Bactrocera tryoni]